jgi:allantoinase
MLLSERLAYSPITQRPKLTLPDGKRVAVFILVSVEEWDEREPMPRTINTPRGGAPEPDVLNWTWHEYGNRVGFWRLLETLDSFDIRASMAINGSAIKAYEPISAAARDRKWEFIGHGFNQKNMQKVEDERAAIRKTADTIKAFTGQAPKGWVGPGLTETYETPDVLVEEGFRYLLDWVMDDQPVDLKTRTTPIVSIPFTQECNDIGIILNQSHTASEYCARAIDQFDQLVLDAEGSVRVMAMVVHPFIMGVAHRVRHLRETLAYISSHQHGVLMTAGEIYDWYAATRAKTD